MTLKRSSQWTSRSFDGPSFDTLQVCVPSNISLQIHVVPNHIIQSIYVSSWPSHAGALGDVGRDTYQVGTGCGIPQSGLFDNIRFRLYLSTEVPEVHWDVVAWLAATPSPSWWILTPSKDLRLPTFCTTQFALELEDIISCLDDLWRPSADNGIHVGELASLSSVESCTRLYDGFLHLPLLLMGGASS